MIIIFLIGVAAVMLAWRLYYSARWDKGLTVSLGFLQDIAYVGDQVVLEEQIENWKRLPVPSLEVDYHMRKALYFHDMENTHISDYTYRRDVFSMLGHQRITRKLILDCTGRGYYAVEEPSMRAFSLFFSGIYTMDLDIHTGLFVYPRRVNVGDVTILCEKIMGSRQCAKKLYEDPFAFRGIREYTRSDPMRSINWKATAKTGNMMVNSYESTQMERVMLYLDLEDGNILKRDYVMEESISIAASLANRLLDMGMEVGIAANVTEGMPERYLEKENKNYCIAEPKSGGSQRTNIEEMLSLVQVQERAQELVYLFQGHPEDTMAIVISANPEARQEAIQKFAATQEGFLWIYPFSKGTEQKLDTSLQLPIYRWEVTGV